MHLFACNGTQGVWCLVNWLLISFQVQYDFMVMNNHSNIFFSSSKISGYSRRWSIDGEKHSSVLFWTQKSNFFVFLAAKQGWDVPFES